MAKYTTRSIGFPLTFNGPDTVEDYDRAAGKTGSCLSDAVENTIYRGTLPEWQDAFAKKVAELTGTTRGVNADATEAARKRSKTPDKVKDILETVTTYVNRVTADMSEEDKKSLAALAQEVADGVVVDPSPSKRQAGVPKEYKAKAESLLTLPTDQLEAKITAWGEKYDSIDVSNLERDEAGKPTVDSLGRLVGQVMAEKLMED